MRRLAGILLLSAVAASPVGAQQWSLEAQAGRMRAALDPAGSEFQNLVIGARYDQNESALRISASVPTSSNQPLWGSLAGSHRLVGRKHAFLAGVDLGGTAFVMHDRAPRTREVPDVFNRPQIVNEPPQSGYAAALQVMPMLGYEADRLQAYLRAGASHYTSDFADGRNGRIARIAEVQLVVAPADALIVAPVVRHVLIDEGAVTFAGVTAGLASPSISLWGSAGRWTNLAEQEPTWAAGAVVRINTRLSLTATGRSDAFDPLYGTPAQTSWNAGISMKLGRVVATNRAAPAVFEAGQAVIELPASATSSPAPRVAGDFTRWTPQPMRRRGNAWVYTATLAPGVYNYAFVDDKGAWFVPAQHPGRKRDGMGGEVAVLVVR